MPRLRARAMNAMPTFVLKSPLHRLLSGRYLLLTFTGRSTGRIYTIPVAYVSDGERLTISTDSPWSRNIADGRPVSVLLRGEVCQGMGRAVNDPALAEAGLRNLVDRVPGYAKAAELIKINGKVEDAEIQRAVTGGNARVVLTIDLDRHAA